MAAHLFVQQSYTASIQNLTDWLHWLPTGTRTDLKIATLTYNILSSGRPAYICELISDTIIKSHYSQL